jgi:hypothetical protein
MVKEVVALCQEEERILERGQTDDGRDEFEESIRPKSSIVRYMVEAIRK